MRYFWNLPDSHVDPEVDEDNGYAKSNGPLAKAITVIVVVALVLLLVFLSGHRPPSNANSTSESDQSASSFQISDNGLAVPSPTTYVYRIVGPKGTTANITYYGPDSVPQTVTKVPLPWSVSVPISAGETVLNSAYLNALINSSDPSVRVTCQAFEETELSDQETTSPGGSALSCGIQPAF